jgi:shikimate dehydrogenase
MVDNNIITAHTKLLCIIGYPIEHSLSPIMHNAIIKELNLDYVYLAFSVYPSNLELAVKAFKTLDIKGINVTIPFKEKIIKHLDEIDPIAMKIGAVNTIKNEDGYLIGRNTDTDGSKKAIMNSGYAISGRDVLILGAGGAARALSYGLANEINKITIVNRTERRAEKLAKELNRNFGIDVVSKKFSANILKEETKNADFLINTTSIGMYPKVDKTPISSEFLHEDLLVFDVVYNPLETKLLKDAIECGCKTMGGLNMLVYQGASAFEWWTNEKPNINTMRNKIIEYFKQKA